MGGFFAKAIQGLGEGAADEITSRRKKEQELEDQIRLAAAEQQIKRANPSPMDLLFLRMLGGGGLDAAPDETIPPEPVLPPELERHLARPGAAAVPGPVGMGGVIVGGDALRPAEVAPGYGMSREDILREVGVSPTVFPGAEETRQPGLRLASINRGGIRLTNPEAIEEDATARARGTTAGMEGREAGRQLAKKRAELQQHLRDIDMAKQQLSQLFESATSQAPAISGFGASPFILPATQAMRRAELALGGNEVAKGFTQTFPIEARKHLQTLEKGGRYTEQDVQQILQAATPQYDESQTGRGAKLKRLIDLYEQERQIIEQQLQSLDSGGEEMSQYSDEELRAIVNGP